MPSDVLNLTAQIVISHASMSELTPEALVEEIKEVFNALTLLEGGVVAETMALETADEAGVGQKATDPVKRYRQGKICGLL